MRKLRIRCEGEMTETKRIPLSDAHILPCKRCSDGVCLIVTKDFDPDLHDWTNYRYRVQCIYCGRHTRRYRSKIQAVTKWNAKQRRRWI